MSIMKKYFYLATALVALASCSSDEFVGDGGNTALNGAEGNSNAIVFKSAANTTTRADHVGADAAGLLNKHFTVGGFKGAGPSVISTTVATGTVFDNYLVNWKENTAATTASNTSDWDYVGIAAVAPSTLAGNTQSIKYWDYSAAQYDFIAYSTGTATPVTSTPSSGQVQVTAITPGTANSSAYTLTGAAADLANCYIADMVTVFKGSGDYGKEVQLKFRSLASKVRVALYETVPGYSIKDVRFYQDASTAIGTDISSNTSATLFTTGSSTKDNFYTSGTYTVMFPHIGSGNTSNSDYNKAHVSLSGAGTSTTKAFGALQLVGKDKYEAEATNYIGRTSATASYAGTTSPYYEIVMPNEEGTVLELRVDYTLLSIDGSGEEIKVHGATAFVPAIYAQWKPNYAYTYIFKISDNTNGWTSTVTSDPAGLYPVTFDAVVSETTEHTQSTITTVATPSITTYQKGHDVTKDEYLASAGDIYVQVMQDGALKADLDTKGKLYVVTARAGKTVTEADVMDALNTYISSTGTPLVVTGRNGWVLTDATSTASVDATITSIPGADGNNITVTTKTAAKFTPSAGTYAYVYDTGTDNADTEYTTAVKLTAEPTGWPTGYYTDEACTDAATTYTNGTYYQKYTNLNKVYGVKVIKVVE